MVERGAGLLDADRAGHAVLVENPAVQRALHERWGDAVFKDDGSVDRKAVARHVFATGGSSELDRRFLEDLLHPHIRRRLKADLARFADEGKKVVVLDAALLFEAGWQTLCDLVVFVDTPRETRLARARTRGWSEADFTQREAAQWPVEDKRRAADFMISNNGSVANLRQAVGEFWDQHIAAST
jgi:dephospho-CoA kinase